MYDASQDNYAKLSQKVAIATAEHTPLPSALPYLQNPNKPEMTESEKRWLSWNFLVRNGRKGSYSGSVPKATIAKRRKANKVAKASRKANR